MAPATALPVAAKTLCALGGGIMGFLKPTFPFALCCAAAIVVDCVTSYRLARRVRRQYGSKAKEGKFRSHAAMKTLGTMMYIYSVVLVMHMIDHLCFTFVDMYLANIAAGVFCLIQVWSILENESSCNDARWARALQKVMVSKVSRHLDVNLEELMNDETTQADQAAGDAGKGEA